MGFGRSRYKERGSPAIDRIGQRTRPEVFLSLERGSSGPSAVPRIYPDDL